MNVVLHFDGSCQPNPGGRCGYGWHLDSEDGERIAEGHGEAKDGEKTNNTAEWHSIVKALQWIDAELKDTIGRLHIRGDSDLVIKTLNEEWKCKKPHLAKMSHQAKQLLHQINARWDAQWVSREVNKRADILSTLPTEDEVTDFRHDRKPKVDPELLRLKALADQLSAGIDKLLKAA